MGKLAFAGLLQGLGQGVQNLGKSIEERRAAALEAARREAAEARMLETRKAERAEDRTWKVEDAATDQANTLERLDKTAANATAAQAAGFEHQSTEADKDRIFKAASEKRQMGHEANMASLRSRLEGARSEREIKLRADIDNGQVLDTYTTEDGKLAIVYKGGRRELTDDPGSRASTAAAGVDPVTGLPVAPATPAKATSSGPKVDYSGYTETIQYMAQANPELGKDREALRRAAFEQAQKYGIPTPPREMKHAKKQGWIK